MAEREYREDYYRNYATVHMRGWLKGEDDTSWQQAALYRIKGWLPSNKSANCLDLGCGHGQLLTALRSIGFEELQGVDVSAEAVQIAKQTHSRIVLGGITEFLQFSTETYDVVFAFDILEHLTKDELVELLRLIRERLKPAGSLILQTPNAVSPWAGHYRYGDLSHELIFTVGSLQALMVLAGFSKVEFRPASIFVHGPISALRHCLWGVIWSACAFWNLVETGSLCGGVYTRNIVARATK